MNCGLSEASRNARRMAAFAVTAWMVLGTLLIASPARAGSIFDDNWTPPKAAKPVEPPPDAGPSKPPKPPETSKPDTQTQPPAVVTPAPTVAAPPARRPVPAAADQAKSRKLFKEIFAAELSDRSAAARRALAAKLLAQAATVGDAPSDQFVLLVGASEAGAEGHDLGLCCQAADALGEAYDVDALHVKSDNALKMTLRADTPAATTENIHAALKLVDQLVAAADYATAARLLYVLRSVSTDADLSAEIQSRVKEVDFLRTAAERVVPYLQKLRTAPDDPLANLMVGRYFCFTKEDWIQGLPLLAKGGKTSESAGAALDLSGGSDPQKQVEIGDAWWKIADSEPGLTQAALRRHAARWYRTALESPTVSGLTRVLVEKRIAAAPPRSEPRSPIARSSSLNRVLWFRNGKGEGTPFQAISNGNMKSVAQADIGPALADPNLFSGVTIVVWGSNCWGSTSTDDLRTIEPKLQELVRNGGDLVIFEQFSAAHMDAFDHAFGIKTGGAADGVRSVVPELQPMIANAGLTDEELKKIHFYNTYTMLPKDAVCLVRNSQDKCVAAVCPFGSGRLILIGTSADWTDNKLVGAILDLVYHWKTAKP